MLRQYNLQDQHKSYIIICKNNSYIIGAIMPRTMTVDLGNELRSYVESLVNTGDYRSNSEVLRESLRLLREKKTKSKLEKLRHLIDEGEASGEPIVWNAHEFLVQMNNKSNDK
jgi:antitoxin ParD1/3/4